VSNGLGMTVLPRHCVDSFEDRKNIKIVEDEFRVVKNRIFIVTLRGHTLPKRVQKVIESFRTMKG